MTADDMQVVAVLGGWPFFIAVLAALSLIAGLLAASYRLALTVRASRHPKE